MSVGVRAGKVDPAAALDEEGVSRDQGVLHAEALRAGSVSGGMEKLDLDVPDPEPVSRVHLHHVAARYPGDFPQTGGLEPVRVDLHLLAIEESGHASISWPIISPPTWSGW